LEWWRVGWGEGRVFHDVVGMNCPSESLLAVLIDVTVGRGQWRGKEKADNVHDPCDVHHLTQFRGSPTPGAITTVHSDGGLDPNIAQGEIRSKRLRESGKEMVDRKDISAAKESHPNDNLNEEERERVGIRKREHQ
jgi:hypothetical protein